MVIILLVITFFFCIYHLLLIDIDKSARNKKRNLVFRTVAMSKIFKEIVFGLVISLPIAVEASASPVAYNTILVIVSIELIFAFAIAFICILFSFNLLRALKDASPETLSIGDLPPRRNDNGFTSRNTRIFTEGTVNQTQYNPLVGMNSRESEDLSRYHDAEEIPPPVRHSSMGSEWDFEHDSRGNMNNLSARGANTNYGNVKGIVTTFFSYLKPW